MKTNIFNSERVVALFLLTGGLWMGISATAQTATTTAKKATATTTTVAATPASTATVATTTTAASDTKAAAQAKILTDKMQQKLVRATMKQAEEAVAACPFIVRCHRAFLVNIHTVVKVDGNSQGYRLLVSGIEEEIPVSRAYAKQVKDQIDAMSSEEE